MYLQLMDAAHLHGLVGAFVFNPPDAYPLSFVK